MTATRKFHHVLRALGAIATLLVLTVGIPAVLVFLAGSPIPTQLPKWDQFASSLGNGSISDGALIGIIAAIGWLAWLHVALAIVVETLAWLRGLPVPHLPGGRVVQPAVRQLVATAALLLSSPSAPTVALTAAQPAAAVVDVESFSSDTIDRVDASVVLADTADATSTDSEGPRFVHTVQRRDTLWALAETHLNSGVRWRDIYELNRGRPQADGRALEDPNLILVGWQLAMPPDSVGIDPVVAEPVSETDATAEAPADTSEVDDDAQPAADAPEPRTEPPAPAVGASTTTTTQAPANTPSQEEAEPQSEAKGSGDIDLMPRVAPFLGGSLLAGALVVLLNRLRRARVRQRRKLQLRPLSDELQSTELVLRATADLANLSRLDLALRALAQGLQLQGTTPPGLHAVRLGEQDLEVLLDSEASTPPAGFESTGNPRGWELQADITNEQLAVLAKDAIAPFPALVTMGTAGGDPVLVDLEAAGVLTLSGDVAAVDDTLRRIGAELATSTWADHLDVITAGAPLADISGTHRSHHFPSVEAAIAHLLGIGGAVGRALDEAGFDTTLAARLAGQHGDGWVPTVFISTEPLEPDTLATVSEAIMPGRGVAVIAAGAIPTRGWHATVDETRLHLTPQNLTLEPLPLSESSAHAIDQILTDLAVDGSDLAVDEYEAAEADETLPLWSEDDPVEVEPFSELPHEVEFRVLGPIDVVGIAPIERRKSMELATYLALHPESVTDDRVMTVFWPDGTPARASFNTAISMTRSALGTDSEGNLYLPHLSSTGQRFQMSDKVTSDLARFEARAAWAKSAPPNQAAAVLEEALNLVRGQPFDVGRGYDWAFAEGFVTRAAITIAEAASQLAEYALEQGDHAKAEWAASRGLLASPGDEALYRARMQAAHQAGNHQAVHHLMTELCQAIEANEPFDELAAETIEAYQELTGRRARSSTPRRDD